ncbi:hypothetical protein Scep_022174 [Stephania cephalantha]|uniref:Uncharacterized protein n=1 Tax=Stephania cephalantha TaxID=152367 RepID=A0AAP0I219_9MAGN
MCGVGKDLCQYEKWIDLKYANFNEDSDILELILKPLEAINSELKGLRRGVQGTTRLDGKRVTRKIKKKSEAAGLGCMGATAPPQRQVQEHITSWRCIGATMPPQRQAVKLLHNPSAGVVTMAVLVLVEEREGANHDDDDSSGGGGG